MTKPSAVLFFSVAAKRFFSKSCFSGERRGGTASLLCDGLMTSSEGNVGNLCRSVSDECPSGLAEFGMRDRSILIGLPRLSLEDKLDFSLTGGLRKVLHSKRKCRVINSGLLHLLNVMHGVVRRSYQRLRRLSQLGAGVTFNPSGPRPRRLQTN